MRDQRWLVYDLGGGTLDIAITSTRDGRLTVLEHRGDNLLGGKDIDRRVVESYLLPALAAQISLPDPQDTERYQLLFRRLAMKAEEAKIELSTRQDVIVSLIDIGDDLTGRPIEFEITLKRADIERAFTPLMERTLQLAEQALAGARLTGKDLNRILLVGGPTQMPYLRAALGDHLQAPVDHSLDPMTVVARGAAIYAASVELAQPAAGAKAVPGAVSLQLAYEPVSASIETQVAGKILGANQQLEVRIDAPSGWLPVTSNYFEVNESGKICPFYIYLRDNNGQPSSTFAFIGRRAHAIRIRTALRPAAVR